MYYDKQDFPFTAAIEQNWERINKEFQAIREELTEWVERELYDNSWKLFMMYDFPHGRPVQKNIDKCPFTAKLISDLVPNHGVVTFSVLHPDTNINPHKGFKGEFLRCHLGLNIPEGDCMLRVAGVDKKWQQGKTMVFDDRAEHAAWNRTKHERSILLFDFVPDPAIYTKYGITNPAHA